MPRRTDEYAKQPVADTARELQVDPAQGLSATEAGARLQRYGYNQVEEKEEPLWHRVFRRFWGPIPWMIEAAAILSALVRKWEDFGIILVMLLVNAGLDFFQEHRALNALKALKQQLAIEVLVLRDGEFKTITRARPGARRHHQAADRQRRSRRRAAAQRRLPARWTNRP